MRRVPRPLALLLAVVTVFMVAWALLNPVWQAPDEISHFTYIQTVAEQGKLPGQDDRAPHSSELEQSALRTNVQPTIFFINARPEVSLPRERDWERVDAPRDDGGGSSPASGYPPLYYGYGTLAYEAASGADIITRLGVMRLASGLWLLVTVIAAWLLAAELFLRVTPRLITAATVGLWPMIGFVSTSINPDGMLFAWWTLALWMGVRILRRGLTLRRAVALGAVVGAAVITKSATIALLPPVAVLLAWMLLRERSVRALGAVAVAALLMAAPSLLWSALSGSGERAGFAPVGELGTTGSDGLNVRELISYVWQFYLPRLPFMTEIDHHVVVVSELPLLNTWIGTGWATFGWVNVWFPDWVYLVFAAVTALVAALAVAAAVRFVRVPGWFQRLEAPAFLALVVGVTLAALHWTDYRFYDNQQGLFMQGRYLLPVAAVFGLLAAWAFDSLPTRWRGVAAGAWLGGLVVLQLACLGLIVTRFYA